MRLALRLFLAFGLLGAATPLLLGHRLREERRNDEVGRFHKDLSSACDAIAGELGREAERDARLLQNACASPDLAEKLREEPPSGRAPSSAGPAARRAAAEGMVARLGPYVSGTRNAFDLDELVLLHSDGDPIAADPRVLHTHSPATFAREIQGSPRASLAPRTPNDLRAGLAFRGDPSEPTELVRCRLAGRPDVTLLGARNLVPAAERLAKPFGVAPSFATSAPRDPPGTVRAVCALPLGDTTVSLAVTKSEAALLAALASGDRTVYGASGFAAVAAVLLALLFARNLGKPLAQLAEEASKVAEEKARPLGVRGSGEIAELAQAFDRMIEDLAATRRKLAAASRVAAWREVARRVAHEIKNPLMPIRAAVETLRRLRAREDPRFDEYFDEATRTVLDEVQRITTIVGEFTRFARLPPPKPTTVDPREVLNHVVTLHDGKEGIPVVAQIDGDPPTIFADRDQVVQVLVNLVQNAQDAVAEANANEVSSGNSLVRTEGRSRKVLVRISGRTAAPKSRVAPSSRSSGAGGSAPVAGFDGVVFDVEDDGNGVPEAFVDRLFEPYATTKQTGTGLGLAIAARIAVEHDGDLSYRRAASGGACFRLVLPCTGPPGDDAPVSSLPNMAASRRISS
jgi:signal transduction histidine kinase